MTMLVCFTKVENGEIIDRQYHVFLECSRWISFVNDSLYKKFVHEYDYAWSAVPFEECYADACGFTMSKCEAAD